MSANPHRWARQLSYGVSMPSRLLLIMSLLLAPIGCSKSGESSGKFQIAAAADLALAFAELGKSFEAKHHATPVFTFGSTGLLAKQIGEGAPFSLFAAANESFAKDVVDKGKCDGSTLRRYARGAIVVWTPASVKAPANLAELADPRFKRIAIANPEHAPYGKAAKKALQTAGIWDAVEPRIVLGDNVRATLQFAQTGNVDAAIIALSLSVSTEGGSALPIDPAFHDPIDQALVVCGTGKSAELARTFADYVLSPEGREVMTRYGFSLPEPK
jgi:molybdate transport system substrate-binding protein